MNGASGRMAILHSAAIAGDRDFLLEIAGEGRDAEVRAAAIEALGIAGGHGTMEQLLSIYESEPDVEVRGAVIHALFIQGEVKTLIRIARTETDPELKREAVRKLSHMESKAATDFMLEILGERD